MSTVAGRVVSVSRAPRGLAIAATGVAMLAWALTAEGTTLRTSGAARSCVSWPGCSGAQSGPDLVHRGAVLVLAVALLALAAIIGRRHRSDRPLLVATGAAVALLACQVAVGAATAVDREQAWTVLLHYGVAALMSLSLTVVALLAWVPPTRRAVAPRAARRLPDALVLITFVLLEVGVATAVWPHSSAIAFTHRLTAGAALVLALAVWWRAVGQRPRTHPMTLAAEGVAALFLAQAAIGMWVLERGHNGGADLLHATTTSLAWLGVCTLAGMTRILPAPDPATAATTARQSPRDLVADYITLVKPGIMLLILITAYGAMAFAANGLPSLRLTLATILGLALSSGGASAINHYADRDIDQRMKRTAVRPVASGRVEPEAALGFGIGLMVASFAVLYLNVNLLTAVLAAAGGLTYVGLYTYWLKRRTPQNIVWGGAAGAVPPLVGWAAVTGHVGLPAVFMFLIIFLWTPPHFWALAILAKKDYAQAGVPMLPVVKGEHETARQIVLYTVLLVGASVLPFATHSFGWIYLTAALLLGARFIQLAVRLLRDTTPPRAKGLFFYSLIYLALMFAAIGIDRIRVPS